MIENLRPRDIERHRERSCYKIKGITVHRIGCKCPGRKSFDPCRGCNANSDECDNCDPCEFCDFGDCSRCVLGA